MSSCSGCMSTCAIFRRRFGCDGFDRLLNAADANKKRAALNIHMKSAGNHAIHQGREGGLQSYALADAAHASHLQLHGEQATCSAGHESDKDVRGIALSECYIIAMRDEHDVQLQLRNALSKRRKSRCVVYELKCSKGCPRSTCRARGRLT